MKFSCRGCWVMAGLASALMLTACDNERPATPPPSEATTESTSVPSREPLRTESPPAVKTEPTTGSVVSEFEAARRKIEDLEKSLPGIDTVLSSQTEGAEGLKAVGNKMLELGKADKLTEMQTIFKSFKASQAELTELFGPEDAAKQWPGYANNSQGFVTIPEKLTADIKDGRYDQIEIVELKAEDKLPRALAQMLTKIGGKTKVFELRLINSQKPTDKKPFRPLVYVNGQWRYLLNLFTANAS